MKNSQFLEYYQHLQYGIMYQKLIDLGFASVAWCAKETSPYFNYAGVDQSIGETELLAIEAAMNTLNRKPTIYFEKRDTLSSLIHFLENRGYQKHFEDSWMFHSGENIDTSLFDSVRKVRNETELEEYIQTFSDSYQKDDPQNPYGELTEYLDVARENWYKHKNTRKLEYFTVYKDGSPVAVSALTNFASIGYISNVGSLREVRGEGYG